MSSFKSRCVLCPSLVMLLAAVGLIGYATIELSPAIVYSFASLVLIVLLFVSAICIHQLVVDDENLCISYPFNIFRRPVQYRLETIKSIVVNPVKVGPGFILLFNLKGQRPEKRTVVMTDDDKRNALRLLKEKGIRIVED